MDKKPDPTEVRALLLDPVKEVSELVKAAAHSNRLQVMVLLADGPREFAYIQDSTGLSKTALSNHITQMLAMGLVERFERGNYRLTEDGGELLGAIANFYSGSKARETHRAERLMEQHSRAYSGAGKEVEAEHLVSREPVYQPSWISYLGAVSGVLKSLGKDRDIVDVGGYTGYAFISNVAKGKTCPSGPTALHCWPAILRATGVLGYRVSSFEDNRSFPQGRPLSAEDTERAKRAFQVVRREIDRDRPVVLWGLDIPEYGIVKGYKGESYVVSTYRRLIERPDGPIRYDALEAPGCLHAVSFREETPKIEPRDDKEAVRRAIKMASGDSVAPRGYAAGPAAFEEWAGVLERGPPESLLYHGNSYVASCIHEAKELSAEFLKRLAERHAGKPQAEPLTEAAREYAASEALLKQFLGIFPFAMEGKMPLEGRRKGAKLLRAVVPHEEAAIAHMRDAHKAWK